MKVSESKLIYNQMTCLIIPHKFFAERTLWAVLVLAYFLSCFYLISKDQSNSYLLSKFSSSKRQLKIATVSSGQTLVRSARGSCSPFPKLLAYPTLPRIAGSYPGWGSQGGSSGTGVRYFPSR